MPRRHGDTPGGLQGRFVQRRIAPSARGCTSALCLIPGDAAGCPVGTGIHPQGIRSGTLSYRSPRQHGDTPSRCLVASPPKEVAPCVRGYTPPNAAGNTPAPGCPVRTGIHRQRKQRLNPAGRLPRAYGDTPTRLSASEGVWAVAPCVRGYTLCRKFVAWLTRGCPVRTGIHLENRRNRYPRARLPRAYGDTPPIHPKSCHNSLVAPCVRGYTHTHKMLGYRLAGCPVRTGIHPAPAMAQSAKPRLPRAYGDTP